MSNITELAENIAGWIIQMASEHGIILVILAVLGLVSIISAIGQKVFKAIHYLFMIFIAIPAILIVGLINKDKRKERLEDLGEIKAHLKSNPDKWKRILYLVLLCVFVLVICLIIWFAIKRFVLPFNDLNEVSKQLLQNYSTNNSGGLS